MTRQLHTADAAEELAALPAGTVLRDERGTVWVRRPDEVPAQGYDWRGTHGVVVTSEDLAHAAKVTVLHRPDLPTQAELHAAVERVRALHTDSPAGFCPSCVRLQDISDTDDGLVAYPCATIRALDTGGAP